MPMPDPFLPGSIAVIVLGLVASVGWGIADFGGGLASRKAPVLGVLLWSQVASLIVGVPLLFAAREPALRGADWLVSVAGGVLGAVGLALLYRGLSTGRMGVVAPVAAVITATMPALFGFITEGAPPAQALVGIACAVTSVALVSRSPSAPDERPSGIWYAVAAGTLFGSFAISATFLGDGLILTPVVLIRFASIITVATWILVRRQPWRISRRIIPALLVIGVVDMSATGTYLTAIAIGPLAIAAILASLYPVVTTVLAGVVVRERISLLQAAGIATAGAAVVLIAGATAG